MSFARKLRRGRKHQAQEWKVAVTVDKFEGDWTGDQIAAGEAEGARYDTVVDEGNLLVIGGVSVLWERLTGASGTAFDNTNAYIGVGDSTTAAADIQTDVQAATNKLRKGMDATYPLHTDSTGTAGSKTITFKATFATTDANFAWQEWGVFNASTAGRMLNRKVESLGTKTSAATWAITVAITIA